MALRNAGLPAQITDSIDDQSTLDVNWEESRDLDLREILNIVLPAAGVMDNVHARCVNI